MPLQPMTDADFRAEGDLDALIRTKEIQEDPARQDAAKRLAETRKEDAARVADSLPGRSKRGFDGSVRKSKMARV